MINTLRFSLINLKIPTYLFFGLLLCSAFSLHAQTTYYSRTTGNFGTASTWSTVACNGTAAGSSPSSTDNIVICSGHTVALTSNSAVNNLTINSGGILDHKNRTLTVSGNYVNNGSEVMTNGNPSLALTGLGTTIDGLGTITVKMITISGGNKTILSGSGLVFSGTSITLSGNITVFNQGTFTSSGSVDGTTASDIWTNQANSTLNVSSTFMTTGTLNASATDNTVNYFASGNQVIATASSNTYYNLTVSGSGIKSLQNTTVISGNLMVESGTMDVVTYDLSVAGNFEIIGIILPQNQTITFSGGNNQTMTSSSPLSFYNLTIDKSAGTLTLNNDIVVSNNLNLQPTQTGIQTIITTDINKITLGTGILTLGTLNYTNGIIYGNFERWLATTSSGTKILFPIGTNTNYLPIEPNFTTISTGGTVLASFSSSNPGNSGLPLADGLCCSRLLRNTFSEGYWSLSAGNGFTPGNYDLDATGNGFTSFPINSDTRLVTRPNSSSAWTVNGTHSAAVGSTAKRTTLTTFPAEYAFADSTNCTGPTTSSITGNTSVCTGVVKTYQVTNTPSNTYSWSITPPTAGTINAGNGTYIITVTWGNTGQENVLLSVTETNGCTSGSPKDTTITIHSI